METNTTMNRLADKQARFNATFSLIFMFMLAVPPTCTAQAQEQSTPLIGEIYRTGVDMKVYIDDGDGDIANDDPRTAVATTKYRVVGKKDGRMYIQILPITSDAEAVLALNVEQKARFVNSENDGDNYYLITAEVNEINRLRTEGFTTGTLLLPLKYRHQIYANEELHPWQLSTDITLGEYLGFRLPLAKTQPIYLNLVGTLGLSTLSLNSDNTEPGTEASTLLGISTAIGCIVQVKDLQLGIVYGRDFAPGAIGAEWIYNEENWLSFGIGLNFLSNQRW